MSVNGGIVCQCAFILVNISPVSIAARTAYRQVRHTVLYDVVIAYNVCSCRLHVRLVSVHHIIVIRRTTAGTIVYRSIVLPDVATQMMIRIEAIGLVLISHAVSNRVLRYHRVAVGILRIPRCRYTHAVAASLEAVAVTTLGTTVRLIAIIERPTVVPHHGSLVVNAVKAVVAVPPRPAALEAVAGVRGIDQMDAEAVTVASQRFRCVCHRPSGFVIVIGIIRFERRIVVVVIICVAVLYKIVAAACGIITYGHVVVHRYILHDAVRAVASRDALTLIMTVHGGLHTDNVEILQMYVVAMQIEGTDAALWLHRAEVKYRTLTRISRKCCTSSSRSRLVQVEDIAVFARAATADHDFRLLNLVSSCTEIHHITARHSLISLSEGCKWSVNRSRITVAARWCHIIVRSLCHHC